MSLRINNNASVLNSHRQLVKNNLKVEKSFEKLSSGLAINRAADSPASLVISERLRTQIASIEQALANTEIDISVLQTAEASLEELNGTLVHMRQLTIHAANEGANDINALMADQKEIEESISAIDRIVRNTSFGDKRLLDGSSGVGGITTNPLMEFVEANPNTIGNEGGYNVIINRTATKSIAVGEDVLSQDLIDDGENLRIIEDGKVAEYTTKKEDNLQSVVSNLNNIIKRNGLNVEVKLAENNRLMVIHKEFGSGHLFNVSSKTGGILSEDDGGVDQAFSGLDVKGTINGEAATGKGQLLTGLPGSPNIDGLVIRYLGTEGGLYGNEEDNIEAGKVFIDQNSLVFQTGPDHGQTTKVTIGNLNSLSLGRGIENSSDFKRIADINVMTHQKASDSMLLLDEAINQVTLLRGKIGAVQKNDLEAGARNLRSYRENMTAAESTIRDTDYAAEISKLTRYQILEQASMAMLTQNNDSLKNVLKLLE